MSSLGGKQTFEKKSPSATIEQQVRLGMRHSITLALTVWLLSCAPALSWGSEGHHIIARIAASELTPAASAAVADLLGGNALPAMIIASTYADEIRPSRRETAPWHYVNIEVDSNGYDAMRDCPNDACVVAQIQLEEQTIGDASISKPIRAEALRFLIHFIGDLHQPLHCADNRDRGGNLVKVVLNGQQTNLHAVWDSAVVEALGNSEEKVAATLAGQIAQIDRVTWSRGTEIDWVNETWAVAKASVYRSIPGVGATDAPIVLPNSYSDAQRAVVVRQLERAGVRLAVVLNRSLK